jgi:hypothetical protein
MELKILNFFDRSGVEADREEVEYRNGRQRFKKRCFK